MLALSPLASGFRDFGLSLQLDRMGMRPSAWVKATPSRSCMVKHGLRDQGLGFSALGHAAHRWKAAHDRQLPDMHGILLRLSLTQSQHGACVCTGIVATVPYAHTGKAAAQRAEQAGEGATDHQLVVSITRISLSRFGEVRVS